MFELVPQHAFLVAVDSDGCVFDTMSLKHQECFIPNLIHSFHLQPVSRFARETWEFVNLHSSSRGVNRFRALLETLEWLRKRADVAARGVIVDVPESLRQWVFKSSTLSNPALEAEIARTDDEALERCLAWSQAVNRAIDAMVSHVPPFPRVRESFKKLASVADLLVCSATPEATLHKEWQEHGLEKYVRKICGQETGSKAEVLRNAGKYAANHVLMVGDAPGDHAAANVNGCLFFPIVPGREEECWEQLYSEGIDRLLQGQFTPEYQRSLVAAFEAALPALPPWKLTGKS